MPLESTPRADGFRMPAEWEPHAGCWMLFPERGDVWRSGAFPAQQTFATVAQTIARYEPLTIGVSPTYYPIAAGMLAPEIRLLEMTHNDAWMRDCGATFVVNDQGEVRGIDWEFNAWGGLYFPWDQDAWVAHKILQIERTPRYQAPLVMEGGALHVDGQGTLITTEECLLNPNRNPHLSRAEIEQHLMDYLNVDKIIWIKRGVYNDETSGHVDNLCCFVAPAEVVLTWTDDPQDPQYDISREAYETLKSVTDAHGRALTVHKLHQPTPLTITEAEAAQIAHVPGSHPRQAGERMAASYVNFYIANGAIIMPSFDDPQDAQAQATLQRLFPDRTVIPIFSREILLGGGNIHCITQQQPRG